MSQQVEAHEAVQLGGRSRPKIRDIHKLVELYEQGYSSVQLAKMFNVTPQAIIQRLKQLNKARNRLQAQRVRRQRERGLYVAGGVNIGQENTV